jgi:hypothetical protein
VLSAAHDAFLGAITQRQRSTLNRPSASAKAAVQAARLAVCRYCRAERTNSTGIHNRPFSAKSGSSLAQRRLQKNSPVRRLSRRQRFFKPLMHLDFLGESARFCTKRTNTPTRSAYVQEIDSLRQQLSEAPASTAAAVPRGRVPRRTGAARKPGVPADEGTDAVRHTDRAGDRGSERSAGGDRVGARCDAASIGFSY